MSGTKNIKFSAKVRIPRIPNFLIMIDGQTIPIHALEDETLKVIGRIWTENLIESAQKKRGLKS